MAVHSEHSSYREKLLSLALGPFLWFGGLPGTPLPDIMSFPVAKHTKGNAQGVKAERPNIRVLKRAVFEQVASIPELVRRLFGAVGSVANKSLRPTGAAILVSPG
jgi:hypothetical protein